MALLAAGSVRAASGPVIFQSAPGRFEVAANDVTAAERVAARAGEGWQLLAAPLGLPERFSTPVFVRLVPAADWHDAPPFRVIVEAGGVVSLRLSWSEGTTDLILQRGLVQALLMRLAVSLHGTTDKLAAPLWIELGCVGWWRTRADAAQLDALKQESYPLDPPALADVLSWQRGQAETRTLAVGAEWLFAWLQAESARTEEWPALLRQVLGGAESSAALAANFPERFANDREREMWWQLGWHHLRRAQTLPALEAGESREAIASLARFVFAPGGREVVTPLGDVLTHGREPVVVAELKRRADELAQLLPVLHPFYRNAGLSLAAVLAAGNSTDSTRAALVKAFEHDFTEGRQLEQATHAALDALEKR